MASVLVQIYPSTVLRGSGRFKIMSLEGFPGLPRTLIFQDATTGERKFTKKQSWNLAFWQLGNKVAKIKDLKKKKHYNYYTKYLFWETRQNRDPFKWFLGKAFDLETSTIFLLTLATPEFWWGDSADFLPDVLCLGRKWYHPFTSGPITSNSHSASMTWWREFCDIIHLTSTWPQSGVTSLLKVVAYSPPIGKNMHLSNWVHFLSPPPPSPATTTPPSPPPSPATTTTTCHSVEQLLSGNPNPPWGVFPPKPLGLPNEFAHLQSGHGGSKLALNRWVGWWWIHPRRLTAGT